MAALLCFSLALHRVLRPAQRGVSGDDRRAARRLARTVSLRLVSAVRPDPGGLADAGRGRLSLHGPATGHAVDPDQLRAGGRNRVPGAAAAMDVGEPAASWRSSRPGSDARPPRPRAMPATKRLRPAELPAAAVPERDLATINIQTRRLVEYSLAVACALALWCAWVDVLPALDSINVDDSGTNDRRRDRGSRPCPTTSTRQSIGRPSFATSRWPTCCLAAIILATTVIAAKNIPGLLEMAVLQHLPLRRRRPLRRGHGLPLPDHRGGRVVCCTSLGVGWSKVQWLVAAMSLGLGFGLQEIFANFVSGLIILFERPVRVGDIVTIDDVTGVVSRIRMRATTITDWDRKELIIPNKEFITGRVLNWTLSDPVNRVVVNVGIAYGSDTRTGGRDPLKRRPRAPHVLADPPPRVMLRVVRRQFAELRAAMLPAEHGEPRQRDPRAAHGHRPRVPRGGHRNRLPAARRPRPLDRLRTLPRVARPACAGSTARRRKSDADAAVGGPRPASARGHATTGNREGRVARSGGLGPVDSRSAALCNLQMTNVIA